jgi:hypothetical protein
MASLARDAAVQQGYTEADAGAEIPAILRIDYVIVGI